MTTAKDYFIEAIEWLRSNYDEFTFFVERDVVWSLQLHLLALILRDGSDFRVYNDYGILPGKRRSLSSDIAILDLAGSVSVAAEFKYEPSHSRTDILSEKLPVVTWGKEGVEKDIDRIRRFVFDGGAEHAYSIFVDEGGYFRTRDPHRGSRWLDWGKGRWVLWAEIHRSTTE